MNLSRITEDSLERTLQLVKATLSSQYSKNSTGRPDAGGKIIADSLSPEQFVILVDDARHKLTLGRLLGER